MGENKKKIQLIDLFAGAGGLSNGFEQTGNFEVAGAVEINEAAAKTYSENHKNPNIIIKTDKGYSDITKIDFRRVLKEKKLDPHNLMVIGGPPCQGFSNANRQKNYLISGNNQLVKEFVRVIDEMRPKAFLMENVKTIKSASHKFFVTNNSSEGVDYGSLNFLQNLKEDLLTPDYIDLISTPFISLNIIFKTVLENLDSVTVLIDNPLSLTRIKKIYSRSQKSGTVSLAKGNEVKEIIMLVDKLSKTVEDESSVSNNYFFQISADEVISRSLTVLKGILNGEIPSIDFRESIGPLLDLNSFLMHAKELVDENIFIENTEENKINLFDFDLKDQKKNSLNSNKEVTVRVPVKSFNVVEYLEAVFKHFGYSLDNQVLTASNFGVPQKRNRFMMLGIKKEFVKINFDEMLPKKSNIINKIHTVKDAIEDLQNITASHDTLVKVIYNAEPETDLQRYYRKGAENSELENHINTKSKELSIKRFQAIKESGGKNFHSLSEELRDTYANSERTQNTIYLRLDYDQPSPTVVNVRKSMWNHPVKSVAISIREAARLQSFRDNFVFYGSKDQQYQQVGNAVPPLLARAVAERILEIISINPENPISEEFTQKN